MIDKANQRR